jgi:hypothetical protein|nr:hypothetical protein Q903MT_gene1928 [Picea sitchensis]
MGNIIPADRSFLTYLKMNGSNNGLTGLCLCLKGLAPGLRGIVCVIIEGSYVFRSSYVQAMTSSYSFRTLINSSLSLGVLDLLMRTFLGLAWLPQLNVSPGSSLKEVGSGSKLFNNIENKDSRVTIPFGMLFVSRFITPSF